MILVDSSAWLEYDRATGSEVHLRLRELIASGAPIATTEPVVAELLASARTDVDAVRFRRFLRTFETLPCHAAVDFNGAAYIYRRCRANGMTPRSLIDCMIASAAMRHDASVLAQDLDFAHIAEVVALDLDPATPRA